MVIAIVVIVMIVDRAVFTGIACVGGGKNLEVGIGDHRSGVHEVVWRQHHHRATGAVDGLEEVVSRVADTR